MAKAENERWAGRETVGVVPLVTEMAQIGKRARTTGRVRVTTRVETEHRTLSEELWGETVEIERVPRDEPVESMPPIRTEDGVTIVPLVEERLYVEKRLVLVEEVRLRRLPTRETVEVPVELRAERAAVERVAPETATETETDDVSRS